MNRAICEGTMRHRLLFGLVVLHCACGHTTSSAPAATVNNPPDAQAERGLYEIILRLAHDPAAQAKLAPGARVVFHGEETTDQPLTDAYRELSWMREASPRFVAGAAPGPTSDEESAVRCVAAELRCSIEQPGGETIFRFERAGHGAGIVLSRIESEEP